MPLLLCQPLALLKCHSQELCFPQAPAALGHPVTLAAVSRLPLAQPRAAVTVLLAPFQSLSEPYVEYLAPFHGASLMMPLSRCLC